MSWLRLEGKDDVHIIPTHDEHPHIVHRDELDRLEILER